MKQRLNIRLAMLAGLLLPTVLPTVQAAAMQIMKEQLADKQAAQQILPDDPKLQGKELWLFGGGEPLCSSVEPHLCVPARRQAAEAYFASREAFREKEFVFSNAQLATLPGWPGSKERQQQVVQWLQANMARFAGKPLKEQDWLTALAPLALSDDEQNLLDDLFELRLTRQDGRTAMMQLSFRDTEPYVQQMFRAFLQSASDRAKARGEPVARPKLLLITASSNDPFQWVDYYLQLFTAAGADAGWLPLEPALAQGGDCADLNERRFIYNGQYNRSQRYPELAAYQQRLCAEPAAMLAAVQQADAIFINGGDQTLTMHSLQRPDGSFTALAQLLLKQVAAGIPLAGSSAGTAVQSGRPDTAIPMISGGRSSVALQLPALADSPNSPLCALHQRCSSQAVEGQLTYKADGGLQTFSLGVTDTHFRQRNREGRLLRLLLDTGTAYGVGVDEGAVLRVNFAPEQPNSQQPEQAPGQPKTAGNGGAAVADLTARLQVLGVGGAWVLDASKAQRQSLADKNDWRASGLQISRILAGDVLHFRQGQWQGLLGCEARPTDSRLIDQAAYQALPGLVWHSPSLQHAACQRSDGQWHYINLPMQAEVKL